MIRITVPYTELYDEIKQEFIIVKEQTLSLEHSLVSISKWESKWHKPFLTKEPKSTEETLSYIKCMTITQNVDPNVYYALTPDNVQKVNDYIEDPMTATWFSGKNKPPKGREQITSELIYYWMVTLNIPFECQKWHINRLLTLIRVCEVKNQPKNTMSLNDIYARNRALNEARKKQLNTKG